MTLLDIVKALEGRSNLKRFEVIVRYLKELNVPFSVQEYDTGRNILVGQGNEAPSIAICSHYDVVFGSPGANDNASAIAVCIDLLDRLGSRRFKRFSVSVFFFDEEENGLRGSRAYVEKYGIDHLLGVINMELVGMGNKFALWDLSDKTEGSLVHAFEKAAAEGEQVTLRFGHLVTNSADHESFRKAGLRDSFTVTRISNKDEKVAYHYYKAQEFDVDKSVLREILAGAPIFEHYHSPTDLSMHLSEASMVATSETIYQTLLGLDR